MSGHLQFRRIWVRRYSDSGQVTAYAEHNKGRTEGTLQRSDHPHRDLIPTFGLHMHALFNAAKRQGLTLQRETW